MNNDHLEEILQDAITAAHKIAQGAECYANLEYRERQAIKKEIFKQFTKVANENFQSMVKLNVYLSLAEQIIDDLKRVKND